LITEVESGETEITRDVATTGEAAEGGEESIPTRQYGSTSVLNIANESGKLLNVLPCCAYHQVGAKDGNTSNL